MKSIYYLIYVFISLISISCSNKTNNEDVEFVVEFDDNHSIPVESIVSDIQFIELDYSTTEAFMSGITNMAISDNKIFCFTNSNGGYVNVFSLNGEFLFKIKHVGKSSKEWIQLTSMFLNPTEKMLVLTDCESNNILMYDLDGNYLGTKKLVDFGSSEVAYNDGLFYSVIELITNGHVRDSSNDHKINVYNSKKELIDKIVPYRYDDSNLFEYCNKRFEWGCNHLLFTYSREETVYRLSEGKAIPYISFSYNGEKKFYSEEDIENAVNDNIWLSGSDKTFYSCYTLESDSIIFRRLGNYNGIDVIYNKNSGKAITTQFNFPKMEEEHLSDKIMYPAPICVYGNRFYSVLQTSRFSMPKEYWKEYVPKELVKYADKVVDNKCNQIIVSYEIN